MYNPTSNKNSKKWLKARPRARQKAVAQKDIAAKIVKARIIERELDRELARLIESD